MSELKLKTTDLVYAYFDSFVNSNIGNVGKVVDKQDRQRYPYTDDDDWD